MINVGLSMSNDYCSYFGANVLDAKMAGRAATSQHAETTTLTMADGQWIYRVSKFKNVDTSI